MNERPFSKLELFRIEKVASAIWNSYKKSTKGNPILLHVSVSRIEDGYSVLFCYARWSERYNSIVIGELKAEIGNDFRIRRIVG